MIDHKSSWIVWRDDEDTFVILFEKKLPEVDILARSKGYSSRAWKVPGDPAEMIPLFNSGRSWRPVGTCVVLPRKLWGNAFEGGQIKEYIRKVLHDITPIDENTRFSGDLVSEPENVAPVLSANK